MSMVVASGAKDIPFVGNNFFIELGGSRAVKTPINSVSGLDIEIEVVDIPMADKDNMARKRPGVAKYGNVTLKRGFTADKTFYKWANDVRDGKVTDYRTDGAIVLYSQDGKTEIARWTFTNAFPSKWSITDPDASKADPLNEEIVMAIEILVRTK